MIYTSKAPKPIGAYSQAIKAGNLIFLSGQIGLLPETGELISNHFEDQLQQVFKNMTEVIIAADRNLNDIAKLTVFLLDLKYFSAVNELMLRMFKEPYPARSVVAVAALPKGALIEVEAILAT